MSLVLNTNMASLVAQNSLTSSGMQLATSLQQLSSGLRVNTAADDAAGYAIAQGMTSQIDGLNQASQNANDGVSLTQTASGALSEVTNDLQTMRDLAVESLNATNSAGDRTDLNAQFQQLANDINSVASQTQFNGVNLLDGSFQGATFQVGANAGQTITVGNVASASTNNLGQLFSDGGTGGAYGYALGNGTADGATSSSGTISVAVGGTTYTTNPVTLTGVQSTDMAAVAAAVNQLSAQDGGIIATVSAGATGGITLSSTNALIGTTDTPTVTAGTFTDSTGVTDTVATVANLGFSTAAQAGTATGFTKVALASGGLLNSASVSTVDSSNLALTQIDAALQQLATTGADLGAYQNRFQAAITGLNTDSTNLSSAKSAIVDTDYAAATSSLSKAQILQQASTAMVAQANTIPQNILTLLQKLP